jgi:hypothetical protein
MDTRTDIMDASGAPRPIADLTGEELRALRALADAGMIGPLDETAARPAPRASQPQATLMAALKRGDYREPSGPSPKKAENRNSSVRIG